MATRVAAEIAGEFQSQPAMVKGSGGVFVVTMDGTTIWDKKVSGRFPDEGEVVAIAKKKKRSA